VLPAPSLYYFHMPQLPVLATNPGREDLVLVGLRLDPRYEGAEFYTLLAVGGDNERPIRSDDRIVFFAHPELAAKALALDPELSRMGSPPQEMETFCDIAHTLHLVNSQDTDPEGVILECLLIFDDLVRATRLHMPDRYQGILTELAARLTERASLRDIFRNHALREHVEDALLWCIGAVAVKSRMIIG
jgi:hypothetical protein